jgi:hypothetical protein
MSDIKQNSSKRNFLNYYKQNSNNINKKIIPNIQVNLNLDKSIVTIPKFIQPPEPIKFIQPPESIKFIQPPEPIKFIQPIRQSQNIRDEINQLIKKSFVSNFNNLQQIFLIHKKYYNFPQLINGLLSDDGILYNSTSIVLRNAVYDIGSVVDASFIGRIVIKKNDIYIYDSLNIDNFSIIPIWDDDNTLSLINNKNYATLNNYGVTNGTDIINNNSNYKKILNNQISIPNSIEYYVENLINLNDLTTSVRYSILKKNNYLFSEIYPDPIPDPKHNI